MTDAKGSDDRKRSDTLAGDYCVVRWDDPSPETKDGLFARKTRLGLPPLGWTCFHCGETFTTIGSARDHFGCDQMDDPACRIKAGDELGLVMALRKAEAEIRRLCSDERDYQQYVESASYIPDGLAAPERPREPTEADILAEFGKHKGWTLNYKCPVFADDDDTEQCWQVLEEFGGLNDREWQVKGKGDTPADAIRAAIAAEDPAR